MFSEGAGPEKTRRQGLLLLPGDAPVGLDFRCYYELEDHIFTLKLTPNRGDCLGVMGIAREVAAITSAKLAAIEIIPVEAQIGEGLAINVHAPDACPLYCGRVVRDVSLHATTPGLADPPTGAQRITWGQRGCGHYQLCDAGDRPATACI